MDKQIPFRCRSGHITIISHPKPTPSSIPCEQCLEKVLELYELNSDKFKFMNSKKDILAYRF